MEVYLLPLEPMESVFYAEGSEPSAEPRRAESRRGLRGWLERKSRVWKVAMKRGRGGLGPKVRRAWEWLQQFIFPDEVVLRGLRSASEIAVHHPVSMPAEEARSTWEGYLQRRLWRHALWLTFDLVMAPLGIIFLTPIPGPNVVGFWFTYRAGCHILAILGICRARSQRVETVYLPTLEVPAEGPDPDWVARFAADHHLKGLRSFLGRVEIGRGNNHQSQLELAPRP